MVVVSQKDSTRVVNVSGWKELHQRGYGTEDTATLFTAEGTEDAETRPYGIALLSWEARSHDRRTHHPHDALSKVNDVEIQKQADLQSAQSQVRQ